MSYGRALVDPAVEPFLLLPAPENAIRTHKVAWRHATGKSGPMHPNVRRATFDWLQEGLGVTVPSERVAALERDWQQNEGHVAVGEVPATGSAAERRPALNAIGVVVRAKPGENHSGVDDSPGLAFGLPDKAWEVARASRYDASADPANDPEMRGFFEVIVGEQVILRRAPVSVFTVVCALARARADSFPERKSVCVLDDSSGTWAVHLVRDPQQPRVQITETYTGASAYAPMKAVAELIDAFLQRFTEEASTRIPELTSWGEFELLARYSKKA